MKPRDRGNYQRGFTAIDNNRITYNKNVVKAPARFLEYEKYILIKKMFNCDIYNYRCQFSDNRLAIIYDYIKPFWDNQARIYGGNSDVFIRFLHKTPYADKTALEAVGGADFVRSIFQDMEFEGEGGIL